MKDKNNAPFVSWSRPGCRPRRPRSIPDRRLWALLRNFGEVPNPSGQTLSFPAKTVPEFIAYAKLFKLEYWRSLELKRAVRFPGLTGEGSCRSTSSISVSAIAPCRTTKASNCRTGPPPAKRHWRSRSEERRVGKECRGGG